MNTIQQYKIDAILLVDTTIVLEEENGFKPAYYASIVEYGRMANSQCLSPFYI